MSNPRLRTKFRAERNVPMSFIWHHCWFAECRSLSMCPAFLYICISVPLLRCKSVFLYFGLGTIADRLIFCRFSVWGLEVRLSCRDGWQGGSLGGRRLRRGPGGHLSWGEYLLPLVLRCWKNAKDKSNYWGLWLFHWANFLCPLCISPTFKRTFSFTLQLQLCVD